jgi:hypothetical protein
LIPQWLLWYHYYIFIEGQTRKPIQIEPVQELYVKSIALGILTMFSIRLKLAGAMFSILLTYFLHTLCRFNSHTLDF